MIPAPVLAAVAAFSLVSPGIRDLQLARSPVSPLIRSQVAPCMVDDLDWLTQDKICCNGISRGQWNMWQTEFTFASEAKMRKTFISRALEFCKSGFLDRLQ